MIIPSDNLLNRAVDFYDPVKEVIFLSKEFWERFFPMFLRDFVNETHSELTPEKKSAIARSVKQVLYRYWHTKYVQQKESENSLYSLFRHVFSVHDPRPVAHQFQSLRSETPIDSSDPEEAIVDDLVSDYAHIERQSVKELEIEAVFTTAAKCHTAHPSVIEQIRSDYEAGLFEQFLTSEATLSARIRFVDECSSWYHDRGILVGSVTLWNLIVLDRKEIGHWINEFPVARFHSFHKQYVNVLSYRRLIDRIGYDVAQMLYQRCVEKGKFFFHNVYEYMFSSLIITDIFKRDIVYSSSKIESPFIKAKSSHMRAFLGQKDVARSSLSSVNNERTPFTNVSSYDVRRNSQRLSFRSDSTEGFGVSSDSCSKPTSSDFGVSDSSGFGFPSTPANSNWLLQKK